MCEKKNLCDAKSKKKNKEFDLDCSTPREKPRLSHVSWFFSQAWSRTLSLGFLQLKETLTFMDDSSHSLLLGTQNHRDSPLMTYELLTVLPMSELKFMY